jgi:hypothetical protein
MRILFFLLISLTPCFASQNKVEKPSVAAKTNAVSKAINKSPAPKGTTSTSKGSPQKPASPVIQKPTVKLKNITLVVEDPSSEIQNKERLVPVDPVELRAKPKSVPVVHMQSGGVKLPVQPVLVDDGKKNLEVAKVGNTDAGTKSSTPVGKGDKKGSPASQVGDTSAQNQGEAPIVESKPILVNAAQVKAPVGPPMSYSPFEPPPPGFVPSTLVGSEPLTRGTPTFSGHSAESLPPLSPAPQTRLPLQANFGQTPIPRATLASTPATGGGAPSPVLSQLSSGVTPAGLTGTAGGANPPSRVQSAFLTDTEAQALLDIAGSAGDQGQGVNTIVGQTW